MRLLLVLMTSKIYFLNRFLKKCLFSDEMRVTANREKFEWFSKKIRDAAKHPDILWFGIIRKLNYKTLWKCWVSLILIFFDDLEHFDYFVPQIIWKFINRLLPPPNLKKKSSIKTCFFTGQNHQPKNRPTMMIKIIMGNGNRILIRGNGNGNHPPQQLLKPLSLKLAMWLNR